MSVTTTHKRSAIEFREKANAIRAELLDSTKTLTSDEVTARTNEIVALDARAAAVAGFTPEAEIERQGGDEVLRTPAPETEEREAISTKDEYEQIAKRTNAVFGSPNGYLKALSARARNVRDFTPREKTAHEALQGFAKRATIVGTTADASGGEFLLPLQQVHEIFRIDASQAGILPIARKYPVSGRTLRIPLLDQTNVVNTRPMAGIANVGYIGENASITEVEPKFIQRLLTVFKVAAYSEIGDETLADDMTGGLTPALQATVGQQVVNFVDEQCTIDGSGTSQITGALHANNTALLGITRNTVSKVLSQDVFQMWTQHVRGPNSKWLVHPSVLPQLLGLTLSGNTLVSFIPSFQGAPQMMLLGIPVEVTPFLAVLGSTNDIALVNGDFYAVALRMLMSVESSIHFKFQSDVTAWRFITRAGGIPIPTGTYSYKSSGAAKTFQVSPFVGLV